MTLTPKPTGAPDFPDQTLGLLLQSATRLVAKRTRYFDQGTSGISALQRLTLDLPWGPQGLFVLPRRDLASRILD